MKILSSIIIGVSILGGFIWESNTNLKTRFVANISAEGKVEEKIKADLFDWSFEYVAVGDSVEEARELAKKAKHKIVELFEASGLQKDEDFTIKPKSLSHTKTDEGKNVFSIAQRYNVQTQKMDIAQEIYSKAPEKLIDDGIAISSYGTDVFKVKNTSEIEKRMLTKALINAREKADNIAKVTGCELIGVSSVYSGWYNVRLRNPNSSEQSWHCGESIEQIAEISMTVSFDAIKTGKYTSSPSKND